MESITDASERWPLRKIMNNRDWWNVYRFSCLKLVSFERSVLVFAYITRNAQYYYMPLRKDIITKTPVIKFRPNTRFQTVGLMKWSDRKDNWVLTSLSYNSQKFIGSSFKIAHSVCLDFVWMMSCCTQGTAQTFRWP